MHHTVYSYFIYYVIYYFVFYSVSQVLLGGDYKRKTITGKRVLVFQCGKQEGDHPKQWEVVGVVKNCVTLFLASPRAPAEPPLSVVPK